MGSMRHGNRLMALWGAWPWREKGMARDEAVLAAARRQLGDDSAVVEGALARIRRERASMSELVRRVDMAMVNYPNETAREAAARYYRQGQTNAIIGNALHVSENQACEYIQNVQITALAVVRCMESERPCGVDARLWDE